MRHDAKYCDLGHDQSAREHYQSIPTFPLKFHLPLHIISDIMKSIGDNEMTIGCTYLTNWNPRHQMLKSVFLIYTKLENDAQLFSMCVYGDSHVVIVLTL